MSTKQQLPEALPPAGEVAPLPAVPSTPLGGLKDPGYTRSIANGLKGDIAADVARSNYPEHCEPVLAALKHRGLAEVAAAAPSPLDPEQSLPDRWALEAVSRLAEALAAAQMELQRAAATLQRAYEQRAGLLPPMKPLRRGLLTLTLLLITLCGVAAVSSILTPTLDAYYLRPYIVGLTDDETGARLSAQLSFWLSLVLAVATLGIQSGGVFSTRGRFHWFIKVACLVGELVLSLAFSTVRLDHDITFAGIAVSGLEFSPLLIFSAVLLAIAMDLERDAKLGDAYTLAQAAVAVAERREAQAQAALEKADQALSAQMLALEERDTAVRKLPARQELVATTTEAEYLVSLSALMSARAKHPADEALSAMLDAYLSNQFERHLATAGLSRRTTNGNR